MTIYRVTGVFRMMLVAVACCGLLGLSGCAGAHYTRAPEVTESEKLGVVMRVASDANFIWDGHLEEIYFPDYGSFGGKLVDAGAIGDLITAMNIHRSVADAFKARGNWATEDVGRAKLMAMLYYTVEEDAPVPPVVMPVESVTVTQTEKRFKVKSEYAHSMVSRRGWESLFTQAGVEVEVVEKSQTTTTNHAPVYVVQGEPKGYHGTLAIEVYYAEGKDGVLTMGRPAMAGMAYFYMEKMPSDENLKQVAGDLVLRMHDDARRTR